MESISCILYFVSNLGNSGVQRFKRCTNWSWNEEVMVIWRQPHQTVWKFRSCEISYEINLSLRKFRSPKPILQLRNELWNHLQAHVCHFTSWNSIFAAANHVAKSPPSCESSCKSSPSCEITSKLRIKLQIIFKLRNRLQVAKSQIQLAKSKFKLAKWTLPTCDIHLCNLKYLQPTQLDFFLKILCKFLFSPCNKLKILLGYFLENIFYIYLWTNVKKYHDRSDICNPREDDHIKKYILQSTCSVFPWYFCFLIIFISSKSNSEDVSSEDEWLGFLPLGVKKVG